MAERTDVLPDVRIAVTRSAGDDRAVTVFIDTQFEPNGSDGGPGLRVLVNDDEAYVGKAYDFGGHHEAEAVHFEVRLADIPYDDAQCVATGEHQVGTKHRWQECPVYHEEES